MQPISFYAQVYAVVRLIPKGKVMSYGAVAQQCGRPGMARAVGYALHSLPDHERVPHERVPWWRVINSAGRISIPDPQAAAMQRSLLMDEGVPVDDTLRTDLRTYDGEMVVYAKLHRRREQGR